jgi:hypothetical protein
MPALRRMSIQALIGVLILCAAPLSAPADDWQPILPEELTMTKEPQAPGATAILLYRQVDRDDTGPSEWNYERIKILTEEGRQYADVEIPFDKGTESIRAIQARTIHPDGTIVNFDGTVYEKPIVQARGVKLLAKTFTMPDVQVGSIIEYRYRHEFESGYVFNSHWILSQDLFTKHAKFSLNPDRDFAMRFSWPLGLPPDTAPPKDDHGKIRLETRNVPAFVTEEYMPPENELRLRVDFIYLSDFRLIPDKDPKVFWKKYGKQAYGDFDDFVDRRRAMTEALAQIVAPGDSPETQLRKIYDRTQRLRNTTFERQKTTQEAEREHLKPARNVEEVWKRGYGDGNQLAWLFLALARAAGIAADPVVVSTRDAHFFNANVMNPNDLNSNVVAVTLDGKETYLDPGTVLVPFGMLPWSETAVMGLRLDKAGGTWVTTPAPDPHDSRIERKARLILTSAGTLEGKVTVTYTGHEALWRRQEERFEDDADRRQFLENQIKADIPSGIDVELSNRPDWDSASQTLTAEYELKVPGWAATAGQRALLPVGLFSGREKRSFQHAVRIHPLYFNFPYQSADDVAIDLPANWQVSSVPNPSTENHTTLAYSVSAEGGKGTLAVKRDLTVNMLLVNVKYYDSVLNFFQSVRAGDEGQVILLAAKNAAGH